jgi:hypothetical protein
VSRTVVVLGSQRFSRTLGSAATAIGLRDGQVAVITAGWREREEEDKDLAQHLKEHVRCSTVNLRLHQRAERVLAEDRELGKAHRKKQELLRFKQDFYRVRLEHELAANHVIRQRAAPPEVLEEEEDASIAAIRALDQYHLNECARVHAEFEAAMRPAQRRIMVRERTELAEMLGSSLALCIAGGHVASLVNRLRLFELGTLLGEQPVIAWSGGAMAICERIVLFHDNTPEGPVASEILDRGIGMLEDLVVLPEAEQRLVLDDRERVSVMARRFAPARVLAFRAGARLIARGQDELEASEVMELGASGQVTALEEAAA